MVHLRAVAGVVFGWVAMMPMSGLAQTGTPSNTIVTTISFPFPPSTLVCSPDNKFVYISGQSTQDYPTIYVVDATQNQIVSTFSIGPQFVLTVDDLAISNDGQTLYTSASNSTLIEVSTATRSVVNTLPYGSSDAVMKPDGSQLWTWTGTQIDILDIQSNTLLPKPVKLPFICRQVVFTPDGERAYIVAQRPAGYGTNLMLVDCSTEKILQRDLDGPGLQRHGLYGPKGLVMDPNGNQVYTTAGYHARANNPIGEIIDVLQIGGGLAKMIDSYGAVGITPDGKYLYAFGYADSVIKTVPLVSIDTSTNQPVGPSLSFTDSSSLFAIRPDGKYAYVLNGLGILTVINIQPSS
jgi:DNA-binding beta-propeller fold protein YncE